MSPLMLALSPTYADRKRDASVGLDAIVERFGEREAMYQLSVFRRLAGSHWWRAPYESAVGRHPLDSDRLELIAQLTARMQAKSKRGTLPRTHHGEMTVRAVVGHLLDANSIVAADAHGESLSEALTELLATERSPEQRLIRLLCRTRRAEVLAAIEYHHECWMATREDAA